MSSFVLISLFLCWMTRTTFSTTPSVSAQFYDEAQLTAYARLSRQIRVEMYDATQEIVDRIGDIQPIITAKATDVASRIAEMRSLMAVDSLRLANSASSATIIYMAAVNVFAPETYNNIQIPVYTEVSDAYGMSYDGLSGETTVPFTGVYAIEDRIQMTDGGYASVDVLVYDTDGTLIHTLNDAAYGGCAPMFQMVVLEAGSVIKFSGLKPYYSFYTYVPAIFLTPGIPSQGIIRYLGPY